MLPPVEIPATSTGPTSKEPIASACSSARSAIDIPRGKPGLRLTNTTRRRFANGFSSDRIICSVEHVAEVLAALEVEQLRELLDRVGAPARDLGLVDLEQGGERLVGHPAAQGQLEQLPIVRGEFLESCD